MSSLDFSIVVPFFNAAPFIERCAQGLLAQSYPAGRYEIMMVDNNSTDLSAAVVGKFDRIRLLQEPKQGSYEARNRGIRKAEGEIVAFTDPDCVPQTDWLEEVACAMGDPRIGVVLGPRQFAADSGTLGMLAAYESELSARIFAEKQVDCYFAYTNNVAIRMSVLREMESFQILPRGADNLFLRKVLGQYGGSIVKYVPRMIVRHLEIAGTRDYLNKRKIYGRLNGNPRLSTPRPLAFRTRLEVALEARRKCPGSPAEFVGFLGVLAAGFALFEWERNREAHRNP